MTDASYLEGHGYTYEGSIPGIIVQILKKCGCMNPIIYFDELDKDKPFLLLHHFFHSLIVGAP